MEAWGIVLIVLAIVVLAVLLFLFCTKTRKGRLIAQSLFSSNGSVRQPLINDRPYQGQACKILDDRWRNELLQYQRINLKYVGDCSAICAEIRRQLRKVSFVEDGGEITVVVTLKTTRVQSDAESALEQIGHFSDHRDRIVLLMFHKVVGSKTVDDVLCVMYQNPDVKKTFHVPYQ